MVASSPALLHVLFTSVAHSMDSDAFLMALHRFMARRGKPQKVFSDNGTNFVAANKELADEIKTVNSKKVQDELLLDASSGTSTHLTHLILGESVNDSFDRSRIFSGSWYKTDFSLTRSFCRFCVKWKRS